MAQWGAYKDDHIVLKFQQTITSTIQRKKITQYDTRLAQPIVYHNDVWTKQVTNPLTKERLQHPSNDIAIMQIYNAQHYTTLISNNDKYYYYDWNASPRPFAPVVQRLHKAADTQVGSSHCPHPIHSTANRWLELCNAYAPNLPFSHISGARTNPTVRSTPRGPIVQGASTVRPHWWNCAVDR